MNYLTVGSVAVVVSVTFAQISEAITVTEYDALSEETQGIAMSRIINGTYNMLVVEGVSQEKLRCVKNFYTQQKFHIGGNAVNTIPGALAILEQLEIARVNDRTHLRVEDLVLGTITAECGSN